MLPSHKATIQFGLDWATSHIQNIEASSEDLHEKRRQIEWQLVMLLDDLVLALPKAMRQQAQACLEAERRTRNAILAADDARHAQQRAQKEASPSCLPASDSL